MITISSNTLSTTLKAFLQSQAEIIADIKRSSVGYQSVSITSQTPGAYPAFTVPFGATHAMITVEGDASYSGDLSTDIVRRLLDDGDTAENDLGVPMKNGESLILPVADLDDVVSFANIEASKTNVIHLEYFKVDISELA